jgi:hypothetical protein
VDHFGKQEFKELLQDRQPPTVSIYVPTSRTTSDWEAERLRFRAALDRAEELLQGDYEPEQYKGLLDELRPLLNDQQFWLHQSDGLAVFRALAFSRVYRLPLDVPELVVVGPSFHTRPLIRYLQAPDRYWVLALSQKDVRLWEGTHTGLRRMNLEGVPQNLKEAVGQYMDYERETFHSSTGSGGRSAYHGHGAGMDAKDWELGAFVRKIDSGLGELMDPVAGPVVLAGVEEFHSLYRSVSQLKNLAPDGIQGNVSRMGADELHRKAWPIVQASVGSKIDEALQLWESAYRLKKAESDVSASARLGVAGRIRLLMTERDRRLWGHFDRATGAIEVIREGGADPGNRALDVLDELAETVILHGGNALALPPERMPTNTGVATVLR